MNIALIPAKFISTRIKGKNFKIFFNRPMIYWTIKTAKQTKLFKKIVISSDNIKIKKICEKYKVDFFLRPKELSKEKYGIQDVVRNYIMNSTIEKSKAKLCCLFPCAPLMCPDDIKNGLKKLKKTRKEFIFAASNFSHPIEKSFRIKKNKINMVFGNKFQSISSKYLKKTYHDTGYFYWANIENWLNKKMSYNNSCDYILIPNWRAQDIDTLDDWKKTELIFKSIPIR